MDVFPSSTKRMGAVLVDKRCIRCSFIIFDPDFASGESAQCDCVVQMARQVADVPMKTYFWIVQYCDGRPGSVRKPVLQKCVDRRAGLALSRSFGDAGDAPMPE